MELNIETDPTIILIDIIVIKQVLFSFFCTFKLWRFHSSNIRSSFSLQVSRCLDSLGYSEKSVKLRILSGRKMAGQMNDTIDSKTLGFILAGSKAEGVTLPLESDIDVMYNFKKIECVECLDYISVKNKYRTVILMDNSTSPPGYTKLNVLQIARKEHREIVKSIYVLQDGPYLANDKFKQNCSKIFLNTHSIGILNKEIAGPALNLQIDGFDYIGKTNRDVVFSLPCKGKFLLEAWVNRCRYCNWPSFELIENVKIYGVGYLVPVGLKGSDNEWLEWRICFTTVEINLMQDLNDAQRKIYIILKRLLKHKIKFVCDNITSYLLKNLVLWLAELNPGKHFTKENLTERLLQSLVVLRDCIEMEYLPSYMIPERNLLAGKITAQQKMSVIDCLNACIQQGDDLVNNLNWPKLDSSLLKSENELNWYELFRDNVEGVALSFLDNYVGSFRPDEDRISRFSKQALYLRNLKYFYSEEFDSYMPVLTSIFYPDGAPDGDLRKALVVKLYEILS